MTLAQYLIGCALAFATSLAALLVVYLLNLAAGARRRRHDEKRFRR